MIIPLLISLGLFGCFGTKAPEFTQANAESALAYTQEFVRDCSQRDSGTEGTVRASDWLAKRLRCFSGWQVKIQTFERMTPVGRLCFRNVLAIQRIPNAKRWILLLSHYDTKSGIPSFVGANDGASSTGLMLQLVDNLTRHPLAKHNVMVAFLDGEECIESYGEHDGFHGSKYLAVECRQKGLIIDAVILADMIGDKDFTLAIPPNVTASLRDVARRCAEGPLHSYSFEIWDDHKPFMELGYPAINFIDFDYGPRNKYWHTAEDTLDKLGTTGYYRTGRTILRMMRELDR